MDKLKMEQLTELELEAKRKAILDSYRVKQPFRVAIGKSVWRQYEEFNLVDNLREVLDDEIVIEFDSPKDWKAMSEQEQKEFLNLSWAAIDLTGVNLYNAGISFEIWDHKGKSPHLHIHNLPIAHLEKDKRALFKKLFIRKYVPREYLAYVDISLTGCHLVAIEWQNHWKGCYGIKELINKFNPKEVTQ
jgi:hypothetical protein